MCSATTSNTTNLFNSLKAWCWHWQFVILSEAYKPNAKAKVNSKNLPRWSQRTCQINDVFLCCWRSPGHPIMILKDKHTHSYTDVIVLTLKWGTLERLQAGSLQQMDLKETCKHLRNCSLVTCKTADAQWKPTCWHLGMCLYVLLQTCFILTNILDEKGLWFVFEWTHRYMRHKLTALTSSIFGGKAFSIPTYTVLWLAKSTWVAVSVSYCILHVCISLTDAYICWVAFSLCERCSCDFRRDVRCFVVEKRSFVFMLQRVKCQ